MTKVRIKKLVPEAVVPGYAMSCGAHAPSS